MFFRKITHITFRMFDMENYETEDEVVEFDDKQRKTLLDIAKLSIAHGLDHGEPLPFDPIDYSAIMVQHRATFVTLRFGGDLCGCIGSLEPIRPLARDVICNAFSAAFSDPRFTPLAPSQFEMLDIHISILKPFQPLLCSNEDDLIRKLRPGIDGLVLEDGRHRGTFLPSVWETLPDPRQFVTQLKIKAGLSSTHWSSSIRLFRYGTESIQ